MAYPFGEAPTLGAFVEKAQEYGAEVRHTPTIADGPNGPIRFACLWIDANRFAPLPDSSYDSSLAPDMVDQMARRLGIPTREFWPGFEGFGWREDEGTD